jgi:hypothetical protein
LSCSTRRPRRYWRADGAGASLDELLFAMIVLGDDRLVRAYSHFCKRFEALARRDPISVIRYQSNSIVALTNRAT